MFLVKNILCLSKIDLEKVFNDVLDKKKDTFTVHKNNCLLKPENQNVSKGVIPSLWSKI